MKYYEEEFEISTRKDLKFKFKKLSSLDVLSLSDKYVQYLTLHDSSIYKSYVDDVLRSTQVCIKEKWYNVREGNDLYMPADLEEDYKGLRDITNEFLLLVINPVFQDSNESSNEQE